MKKIGDLLKTIYQTLGFLVVIVAFAYLLSSHFLPIVKVETASMSPDYEIGDYLLCLRTKEVETGDDVLFYWGNKLEIKKVVASAGDSVSIDDNGDLYINGTRSEYSDKDTVAGDVDYPLLIKQREYFVLNTKRSDLADSRSSQMGNVKQDDLYAKVLLKLWPRR